MITEEKFRETFIRMMDKKRKNALGMFNCCGVSCRDCLLNGVCKDAGASAYGIVKAVTQWAYDHSIKTNEEKLKEVFNIDKNKRIDLCPALMIGENQCTAKKDCYLCIDEFWNSEYKEPEVTKS